MLYLLFTAKILCILEDHKTGVGAIIWAEEKSVSIEKLPFLALTIHILVAALSLLFCFKFIHVFFIRCRKLALLIL